MGKKGKGKGKPGSTLLEQSKQVLQESRMMKANQGEKWPRTEVGDNEVNQYR